MAAKDPQDAAEKLRQQIAKLQAKLKRKQAAEKTKERKDDTRRKIILGAFALEHMEKNKNSTFTKTLYPLLDEYVTRPQDRDLLNAHFKANGLSELPALTTAANDTGRTEGALKSDFPKSTA